MSPGGVVILIMALWVPIHIWLSRLESRSIHLIPLETKREMRDRRIKQLEKELGFDHE